MSDPSEPDRRDNLLFYNELIRILLSKGTNLFLKEGLNSGRFNPPLPAAGTA